MSSGPSLSVPISLDYFAIQKENKKTKKQKNETKERSKYEVPAMILQQMGH